MGFQVNFLTPKCLLKSWGTDNIFNRVVKVVLNLGRKTGSGIERVEM